MEERRTQRLTFPSGATSRRQSGFGILTVLVMAAMIVITLYVEMPRVAFQAQRQKEQLLIDRGEQYQRAIEVFFRTMHRYPAEIAELENSGNRRFLRRRFVDPMTGKDDWRLIRIGPGGVLLDSAIAGSRVAEQAVLARAAAQQRQLDFLAGRTEPEGEAGRTMGSNGQVLTAPQNAQAASMSPPGAPVPGCTGNSPMRVRPLSRLLLKAASPKSRWDPLRRLSRDRARQAAARPSRRQSEGASQVWVARRTSGRSWCTTATATTANGSSFSISRKGE